MIVNPLQEAPLEVNLSSAHDHRLALIFSLLQVFYPKLVIDDRDCIAKSYPDFDRDLSSLTLYEA